MQEGRGEIVEGALAAVTPVAFTAGAVVVLPPRIDVLALAPGTLEGTIFSSQRMDVGVTLVDVEEFVDVRGFPILIEQFWTLRNYPLFHNGLSGIWEDVV